MKASDYLTTEQITLCKMYYYDDGNTNICTFDPEQARRDAEKRPTPNDERWEQLAEWIWMSPRFN